MSDIDEMKVLRVSARAHQLVREMAERERRTLTAQAELIIEQAAAAVRAKLAHDRAPEDKVPA